MNSNLATRPIAVIGSTGQVAMALKRVGGQRGLNIVSAGRPDLDLKDMASIAAFIDHVAPALVINAAAYTAVDEAQGEGQDAAYVLNAEAPARLAVLCSSNKIPLIHLSTEYVFNGMKGAPYLEDDVVGPLNIYGASKAAGEMGVRASIAEHIILRTQWIYGPDGRNFAKTMLHMGAEKDEVQVVNDQIGVPTLADDVASALLDISATVVDGAPDDHWGTFHFANHGVTSWFGFAEEIFRLAADAGMKTPKLTPVGTLQFPTPAVRPPQAVLACEKVQQVYGIVPSPWEEALARSFPSIIKAVT